MLFLILYVFLYCNADIVMDKLYLSYFSTITNNELIKDNLIFYYSFQKLNIFVLFIYSIYILKNYIYYKLTNITSNTLAFVYIKYTLNMIFTDNMTISQNEFSRNIMWLFSTQLMLKMYCDINKIKYKDINIQYHIIPITINILIYPWKNTNIYYYFTGISWISLYFFIKTLYQKQNLTFTNIYLFIWIIFMLLTTIDTLEIIDKYDTILYYSLADMISKLTTCIIINDYYEKEILQRNNMDLQSVQFVSYMIKYIKNYKEDNLVITPQCNKFIDFTISRLLVKIPENKSYLEQELLKKMLPFNFDKEYINNINIISSTKHFDMICILFTDIVNYTELAKKYNDKIIFQLLDNIYKTFDKIIKKYPHLQKIETIGDAYMVVGDIYRNSYNHTVVIKEIIIFALEIITEIKAIKTPDNIPLSLRIGIHIGDVSIGILGNEIPRLCVVGNAVNVASRLQSTAEIDTIQFNRHIYEHIKDIKFDNPINIVSKESVFLKNLGSITTYNIMPCKKNNFTI